MNVDEPLDRMMELFALSEAELGALLGVAGEVVEEWCATCVPDDRLAKVADMLELADLLEHKLKPERIAATVRRPADAYGGRSMLDLLADNEHAWLLEDARRTFDWSETP